MGGGEAVGAAAGIALAVGFAFARAFHPSRKVTRRFEEFLDDWNGQPERRTPDGEAVLAPRRPGVPERLATIESQLNGGGFGAQLNRVESVLTDHIDSAGATRDQIVEDIRDVRRDLGDAVMRLAAGQQSLEERVDHLDETVKDRLFPLEEANQGLLASVTELLAMPSDDPDDAA